MKKLIKSYIPQIVYGGVDGTISTLALVSATYGASSGARTILIISVAGLIADGFSMAVSAFLSAESDPYEKSPFRAGLITFLAFTFLGSVILLPYIIGLSTSLNEDTLFIGSVSFAVVAFIGVGAIKSKVENNSLIVEVAQVVFLGLVAALIAFSIGDVLEAIIK